MFATKDCSKSLESCLRCDETGFKCLKCKHLIVFETRNCVKSCPMGYTSQWSTYDDYMGQICVETSFAASLGFTGETSAVLVGSLTGLILCLGALLGGCIYIRRRRIKALATMDENSDSTMIMTPLHQQGEFLREISLLRHEAPVFLSMLNETRRQVREIARTKLTNNKRDSASQAYRPVLRDLYVILILLNKPEEKITNPPQDWRKLISWGERVLKRYKRQHNLDAPVGQLVTFLDVPEQQHQNGSRVSLFQPYCTLSTVSTNTLTSTVSRKLKNALNSKSDGGVKEEPKETSLLKENLNGSNGTTYPLPGDDISFSNLNRFSYRENNFDNWDEDHTILAEWSASQEYSFEDDFIRLGFRPQDEITTELSLVRR
ncbi:hypothetical protein Phum_PHUM160600 [Pediculus humanus corporis]|uniref:Uncharacterized protein n=1 Tax=Pediculus humanus subsp. corporis TaxID=121224 RepID=E0VFK9_PEDHC|nr:uncharacterized protein Phum_PHUM160600 [Pediculus humanus corporis]EEB12165.1 hypothetical protein Phum_PHUM160600 [Pediculus humanus corporis]